MGKAIGVGALLLVVLLIIGTVAGNNDKEKGVGATATAAVATAAAVRGNAPLATTAPAQGSGTGSNPQVITLIVTATPVPQVAASGNTTSGAVATPVPQVASSAGSQWRQTCTNGAFVVEEPDGNLHMTSEPAQGYECDFWPTMGGDRYWKGVNAILSSNGTVIEPRNTANNTKVTITPGQQYHVQGFQSNGGFALQRSPS
ncbi:MAG: hypothetical protein ACR2IV_17510 [Bryobacteraceae bacterium]